MRVKTFFLFLLIIVLGVFVYISVKVRGDLNSDFNQTYRYKLGRNGIFRALFGLHNDGDARAQYLLGGGPLVVEIVEPLGLDMPEESINDFTRKISNLLGRETILYNVDHIPSGSLGETDLEEIVKEKRRHFLPGQPNLFIVYAEDYIGRGGEVGKTYKEFAILLSHKGLKEITNQQPEAFKQYLETTVLHEFGHQIGLPHNGQSDCIMNEKVNRPEAQGFFDGFYTPDEFCALEKQNLEDIKKNL
ncbi:MAG: hypothetical protein NTX98_03870 [Candidatus Doudnabacteria bacterium]|nr:hypothetical protein [Candidatus Doudnabacteria bacterium]